MDRPTGQSRPRPRARYSARVLVALLLSTPGCRSNNAQEKATKAQETFTKDFSCPKERVIVTPRPDLTRYDLDHRTADTPPKEVAADPGRLAEWKKSHGRPDCGGPITDGNCDPVFQVKGCDHEETYTCGLANEANGAQVTVCTAPHG
jgi:hypothetical protein